MGAVTDTVRGGLFDCLPLPYASGDAVQDHVSLRGLPTGDGRGVRCGNGCA